MIAIDDQRILLMLKNRDEQALRETEKRYGMRCRTVASDILRSSEDAEECVNEALMRMWETIPPASPDNYYAYLLKTVRNIALDRLKRRMTGKRGFGERPVQIDEVAQILVSSDNVESEVDRRELLDAITRFLQSIPKKQRDLFLRRYWRLSDFSELARDFDMTENHVQVTLSRLRKKLRDFLRKEGLL